MRPNTSVQGFNPRTREGATLNQRTEPGAYDVSIHAPVKVRHLRHNVCGDL